MIAIHAAAVMLPPSREQQILLSPYIPDKEDECQEAMELHQAVFTVSDYR
jgi:hypothetical protein